MSGRTGRMTAAQFVSAMRLNKLSFEDVAIVTGRSVRTIRSYYYGERRIPVAVETAIADIDQYRSRVQGKWLADIASASRDRKGEMKAINRIIAAVEERMSAQPQLTLYEEAVSAFCRSCSGRACSQPECELRPVSPLPLSVGAVA